MRLLRDLWATSRSRTALVAFLIVIGASGAAGSLALAGPVLVDRSVPLFTLLAVGLVASVLSDVVVGLVVARLTADWAARNRRILNQVAFGQDIPTLENTPVGELLDRIDSDVYQVGAELRGSGVRLAQSLAVTTLSMITTFFV
jgi:ATP-binding cassette, subfamily B, bacterial